MQYFFVFLLLTFLVCSSPVLMICNHECRDDECCYGTGYMGGCKRLATKGDFCERKNKANDYRQYCPCQDGLFCNVIGRCQAYE
ncbi:Hainantoxin-XIV-7, partial [Stegodyphus mimosarum]